MRSVGYSPAEPLDLWVVTDGRAGIEAQALGLAAPVWLSLRPEALRFAEEAPAGWPRLTGTVSRIEMLGPLTRLDVVLANGTVLKMATLDAPHHALAVTAAVALAYDPARLVILP